MPQPIRLDFISSYQGKADYHVIRPHCPNRRLSHRFFAQPYDAALNNLTAAEYKAEVEDMVWTLVYNDGGRPEPDVVEAFNKMLLARHGELLARLERDPGMRPFVREKDLLPPAPVVPAHWEEALQRLVRDDESVARAA